MRYRLAVLMLLMLLAVMPVMNVLAAPAPDPSVILDIGPPPKGETAEAYRKRIIDGLTLHCILCELWNDPEVRKLSSVAPMKDACPWLARNLRGTEEDRGQRIRLAFRAGTRAEQVVILNAMLRVLIRGNEESIKFQEECLRSHEACIVELERRIASGQHRKSEDSYRMGIDELRSIRIPEVRAEIARLKQCRVIKWAK